MGMQRPARTLVVSDRSVPMHMAAGVSSAGPLRHGSATPKKRMLIELTDEVADGAVKSAGQVKPAFLGNETDRVCQVNGSADLRVLLAA